MKYLDELICFLRNHNCRNIQEKLSCVSDDWLRFRSAQSELELAKVLILRGKAVDFIPENYMDMVSPPDLLVVDKNIEAYVEVKLLIEDPTMKAILDFLRQFLPTNPSPCIVNIELNKMMSVPAIGWYERQLKEEIIRKACQEFKTQMKTLNSLNLPMEIKTNIGKFEIHKSPSSRGYPGIITTSVITLPEEKMIEKIRDDVVKKASKREKWTSDHHSKIFIVALDFEEMHYDEDCINIALIGCTNTFMSSKHMPPICETKDLQHAKERGWEKFLLEKYILPRNQTYLDNNKKGIFFTEPKVKNISGVISKHGKTLYFIPNPFSFDEINDPKLTNYL
jgi:hypothetical protein